MEPNDYLIWRVNEETKRLLSDVEAFSGKRDSKNYLFLQECLMKNVEKLDGIDVSKRPDLRSRRKNAIRSIYIILDTLDKKVEEAPEGPEVDFLPEAGDLTENNIENVLKRHAQFIKKTVIPRDSKKSSESERSPEKVSVDIQNILDQIKSDIEHVQQVQKNCKEFDFDKISSQTKYYYDLVNNIDVNRNEELREKKIKAYYLIRDLNKLITDHYVRDRPHQTPQSTD